MNVVFIIPTGIGCTIGGHAGDATPAARLIASICDTLIIHPNVVNASDINEMTENMWYVEGSMLDRFLEGEISLKKPRSNKILLAVNELTNELYNAVSAAQVTMGADIGIVELKTPLKMVAQTTSYGASGEIYGWEDLVEQTEDYDFDALAIGTPIDVDKEVSLNYFRSGGINPWGGVEAKASKLIATALNKPIAHAPTIENDPDLRYFSERVDPRMAPEVLSTAYIHCVFKGLHKAPRISNLGMHRDEIDCLISPWGCYGRPHEACQKAGIPVIMVEENKTCHDEDSPSEFITAKNYLEVAGLVASIKAGIRKESIRRAQG